jgi:hypothetical protein
MFSVMTTITLKDKEFIYYGKGKAQSNQGPLTEVEDLVQLTSLY